LSHTSSPFLLWLFLETKSHQLFAQAGLKQWSSQPQPPK
jgi:hypothetical protein